MKSIRRKYGWWYSEELCASKLGIVKNDIIKSSLKMEIPEMNNDYLFNEMMNFINGNINDLYFNNIKKYYKPFISYGTLFAFDNKILKYLSKMNHKIKKVILFNEQSSTNVFPIEAVLKKMGIDTEIINLNVLNESQFKESRSSNKFFNLYILSKEYNKGNFSYSIEKESNSQLVNTYTSGNKIENIIFNRPDLILENDSLFHEFEEYYMYCQDILNKTKLHHPMMNVQKIQFITSFQSYARLSSSHLPEKMKEIMEKGLRKKNKKYFINTCL